MRIIEDFRGTPTVMGMGLEHFGAVEFNPSDQISLHTHGHYEFCLAVEGTVDYRVGERRYIMTAGDLCITRSGEFHGMSSSDGKGWRLMFINIRELQLEDLDSVLSTSNSRVLKENSYLESLFGAIFQEARNPRFGSVVVIHSLVARLLVDIARQLHITTRKQLDLPYSDLVSGAIEHIGKNGTYTTSVDDIARQLGVSGSWLSHRFKQETGQPLRSYLRYILIERARRLLEDDILTISEVAERLGFPNQACFSGFFRSHIGDSPREYRHAHKGI